MKLSNSFGWRMMMPRCLIFVLLSYAPILYSRQVTLRPWTQMFGTVGGQKLGGDVLGITPSANLPYRAAITRNGRTCFYRLETPTDTATQLSVYGGSPHIGDLNGDGWKDVIVSVPDTLSTSTNVLDTVAVYWGTPIGLDTLHPTKLTGSNSYTSGVSPGFGWHMCIGKLIGDSTDDLVVCEPYYGNAQGRVYIYEGGNPFAAIPSIILAGDSAVYTLGDACTIGDVDNDGYNDLMVRGKYQYGYDTSRFTYVDAWRGGATFDTTRYLRLRGGWTGAVEGLACFDVNGDGISDLLWTTSDSGSHGGATYVRVHYGGPSFSIVPNLILDNPGMADFGNVIVNAGDMNGDGYNDIAVGAFDANITSGFVVIFAGGPKIDVNFDAAVGMSSDSWFGWSVSGIGDVNGDGLSDIIIGAPKYDFETDKGYWGIFLGDTAIYVTAANDEKRLPKFFKLYQAYPNPFNPKTTIRYDLEEEAKVILTISNESGQHIATLISKLQQAGMHETTFDGSRVSSGVYFYTLSATTNKGLTDVDTKKLILAK